MVSNSFLKSIYFSLSFNSSFEEDDFSIIIPEGDNHTKELTIKYIFDESYYFKTYINSSLEFRCEFSPGKVMLIQNKNISQMDDYFSEIRSWVSRMEDEFNSTPLARKVIKNQSQVEDLISKVDSLFEEKELDPNEGFSHSEMEDMENKLEEFKALIEEKLAEQINEKESLEKEVKKLFREINFLKQQVQTLTKKNWFAAFLSKTGKFIRNNPETTKAIANTARELLPEEIKMSIPDGTTDVIDTFLEEQKVN
jgi:hypothetical protein